MTIMPVFLRPPIAVVASILPAFQEFVTHDTVALVTRTLNNLDGHLSECLPHISNEYVGLIITTQYMLDTGVEAIVHLAHELL